MRNTIAIFFLLASMASAQTLESWTVDTDKAVPRPLVIRRGETRDLRVTFKNYSAVAAIPTNASVQLWYRSADMSNGFYYVITGTVHSASAGVARVLWTAAACGTATNYTWDLVVLSNTTPYNLRAYGTIQLQAGVYSQATTATNPATYLALDWAHIINLNTNSAPFMTLEGVVTNGGATIDGQVLSNGAVIVTAAGGVSGATVTNIVGGIMATGACATATTVTGAQSNRIEMALTNAADFYSASNPSYYQTAAQVQGAAATVAGNVFTSFIGNPYSYRGSFTGHVLATSGNVLTNAADFATAAQGSKADTALQPAATNGWETGPHTGLVTRTMTNGWEVGTHTGLVTQAQTNGWEVGTHTGLVTRTMTNGWEVGSHANLATNAGGAGAGYYAMSNGAWTAFAPGAGGAANAVTNGGATINGSPITNGASFTITGGGGGGGLSNIVVAGVYGTYSGSGSNLVASVSLAALAGAGVATNAGGAGAGYYAMSNGAWTAFAPGSGSAQTQQLYVGQAGTAQVAVAAETVTGMQSNRIAAALTNGQHNVSLGTNTSVAGKYGVGVSFASALLHVISTGTPLPPMGDADVAFFQNNGTTAKDANIITASGSAGTCGYWLGDSASVWQGGMKYNNSDDSLGMYANGSERLTLASSGNAGIGTTTPAARLDVNGGAIIRGATTNVGPLIVQGGGNVVTNGGCTINGQSVANGADLTISGTGAVSAAECTNIVRGLLGRFAVTNTFTVTNSATFSIPLPYSSVCLDDVRVFGSTVGSYSKRYALRFFRNPGPAFRRTDLAWVATNGLLYATTTTVAQAVGSITNVVPDASGIVWPIDMYWQNAGGTTNDYVSFTNATATVLWGCCTNTIAMPVGSLISHVEQLGSFNYWDASGGSAIYGDIVPTTGWTGDVTVVISGALR
jgi:hypothetical protein